MRAIWSGALSFGLINIPIKIYSASEERALKFRLLDKHGHCPISYAKVCRDSGKEVKYEDIVKGYEYAKGDYVVLSDEDFKKASPKKTKAIDIVSFVDEKEVPDRQISKPYFIEPDPKAEKAYVLLREALKRSKKVGLAKYVFRDKEHLGLVRPEDKALMLIELRYQDELRSSEDLHIPEKATYSKKELDIALMLITQLEEHFDASKYKDTYTDELKKVIEKKAKGKPIKVKDEPIPTYTDMRDLMSILKESLEKEKAVSRND
jgi:DNA end-binding protein Ku